ncbi:MAG: hypothetical protein M1540_03325 [Candidatus Bathyarchaeota archaeon]|nr:hypothetical protein [Candidatus Bathyarchaeota archaeon]
MVYKMLEGESKLLNRPTQTAGKQYDKYYIYIPTDLARDSAFPFEKDERLKLRIDPQNKRLIIEKV